MVLIDCSKSTCNCFTISFESLSDLDISDILEPLNWRMQFDHDPLSMSMDSMQPELLIVVYPLSMSKFETYILFEFDRFQLSISVQTAYSPTEMEMAPSFHFYHFHHLHFGPFVVSKDSAGLAMVYILQCHRLNGIVDLQLIVLGRKVKIG